MLAAEEEKRKLRYLKNKAENNAKNPSRSGKSGEKNLKGTGREQKEENQPIFEATQIEAVTYKHDVTNSSDKCFITKEDSKKEISATDQSKN